MLCFDPGDDSVSLVRDGLAFANGVAIDRDAGLLYLAETGKNRVLRLALSGPQAGTWSTLIEGLFGFFDNVLIGR